MKYSKSMTVTLLCIILISSWLWINRPDNFSNKHQSPLLYQEKKQISDTKITITPPHTIENHHHPTPQASALETSKTLSVSEILEVIKDFAVTYDPKQLVNIEPFLLHTDLQVRNAAIDGMITLGDASASVMLRNASTKAPTSADAIAMLQAAEYLELPSASGIIKKRKTK